jgi:hypothetical protein
MASSTFGPCAGCAALCAPGTRFGSCWVKLMGFNNAKMKNGGFCWDLTNTHDDFNWICIYNVGEINVINQPRLGMVSLCHL